MSDINTDTQEPQEPQDGGDTPVTPVTFIIMKNMGITGCTVPVFVAYVDVPSDQYQDIGDTASYAAPRRVLDTYLNVNQPDNIAGTWWVGRVPTVPDPYAYDSQLHLERFDVQYLVDIRG